jgi:membrane protease YdiL (CAAX protease family)
LLSLLFENKKVVYYGNSIEVVFCIGTTILLIAKNRSFLWNSMKIKSFRGVIHNIKIVVEHLLLIFFAEIAVVSQPIFSRTTSNEEALNTFVEQNTLCAMIDIAIVGPILEELVYRMGLFCYLRKKNVILAHIVTSVVFAMGHSLGAGSLYLTLIESVPYFVVGLVLSLTYERSKTIYSCIVIHMLYNSLGFINV